MMNPTPHLFQILMKATTFRNSRMLFVRISAILSLLLCAVLGASAQSLTWTDSFQQGVESTPAQCGNWRSFLDQLEGKSFASVTISGTFDMTGKTLADPAGATELARLLASRTPGTVEVGGHTWSVTKCMLSVCADESDPYGIALSYDGDKTECACTDTYSIRPEAKLGDWGGINVAYGCGAASQVMKVEFKSGVSISASGSTVLCEGSNVKLTAKSLGCPGEPSYLWSNGATTQSITVTQPGSYTVSVCGSTSDPVVVTGSDVSVIVDPVGAYCDVPVQLNATGTSGVASNSFVNQICIYNAPGGAGVDDCTFTSDVCLEGAAFVGTSSYATNVTLENPVELRYHIYYSAFAPSSTFKFLLNGHEIGSYLETDASGNCETEGEGKFPRSFTFDESTVKQHWIAGGANELKVGIVTDASGIYLAGVTAEVVTSNETYLWSPIAGLSNASIRNPLASPAATTPYKVTYTDANGCSATANVEVKVKCDEERPVAVCKELTLPLTQGCEIFVDASAFDGGSTSPSGGTLSFSTSHEGAYPVGETEVTLTVTDSNGGSSSCTTRITVIDSTLPVIATPQDIVVSNDQGTCSALLTLQAPQASDNCALASLEHDQALDVFPVGETVVTWTATDSHGNKQTATQKIIVTNAVPVINSVMASASAVAVDNPITLTTTFTDNNARVATVDWGDLSAPQTINNPSGTFEVSHSFDHVGFYSVSVTVTDHCGESTSYQHGNIVVYDAGASVRGDGWFHSDRGFYFENPRTSGKAQFHVEAKYSKGSSVPVGRITFRFKAGRLDFRSTQLEWAMIDDDRATVFGTGKLNGSQNYSILIAAVDADCSNDDDDDDRDEFHRGKPKKDEDQVRVKIWDPSGNVIYDTQAGEPNEAIAATDLDGGSIEIKHSKLSRFGDRIEDAMASHFGDEATSVYPNPFKDYLNVQFNAATTEDVIVKLIDLTGKAIAGQVYPVSEDGFYMLDIPEDADRGIYILIIRQGKRVEYLRMVRK